MNRRITLGGVVATLPLLVACLGPSRETETVFHRDIAPIIFAHCTPCHRQGGGAPFPLETYRQVRKRGRDIVDVTESGYMPPWQPTAGFGRFRGERRLEVGQKKRLSDWFAAGMPAGDPAEAPPAPEFAGGWQLGVPDLEVAMIESFVLPASGIDEIRNFVIPIPLERRAWVRAVELLPGNPAVIHHAVLKIDRTGVSRRLDLDDPAPGFAGMAMGNAESPDGHQLVWAPGTTPDPGDSRLAWPAVPGSDLVLQLHMVPSGREEQVHARIGFHFTDHEPELRPLDLLLEDVSLDIPPGDDAYLAEDRLELPMPITVLSVFPHAHYLGKQMEVYADLPGGERRWLLKIENWDFNWQGAYRFIEPLALPAGTTLHMRYRFDNSVGNLANPSYPPRRVTGGNRSTDEMATLALQVVTDSEEDKQRLYALQFLRRLERNPDDAVAHYNLGVVAAQAGDLERAADYYGRAISLDPADPGFRFFLANVRYRQRRFDEALALYGETLQLDPGRVEAHLIRGWLLEQNGDPGAAAAEYRSALARAPEFEDARAALQRVEQE